MRSSSAEPAGRAAAPEARVATLGAWGRLVLGVLLLAAGLVGPAVGLASARFGGSDVVTISITVPPTSPGSGSAGPASTAPVATPDPTGPTSSTGPTAKPDEPAPVP